MKRKRLNRDGWGFQYYPYYQMRIDHEKFHGLACLIRLTEGEDNRWEMPGAGGIRVTGGGMTWLEMVPDGTNRVITVMYFPDGTHDADRLRYPGPADERYQPSVWYIDIIDGMDWDDDGIAVFADKYLDVIMTPEGDVKIDDRDELDEALACGEITREQYDGALAECDAILREYCADIRKTDAWCAFVRRIVEERIAGGESVTLCREARELRKRTEEYAADPCRASSLPFWKTVGFPLPENVTAVREDLYDEARYPGRDRRYFRMVHRLEDVRQPELPPQYCLVRCGAEDFARHIAECYTEEGITADGLRAMARSPVHDPGLWIALAEKGSGRIVATGIADADMRIGEGILEWIQVSPDHRRRGLGRYIVMELLHRMEGKVRFATVSGKMDDPCRPYELYRTCGFTDPVIWHIISKVFLAFTSAQTS